MVADMEEKIMRVYINEPIVQPLPVFFNFMGGLDFIGSVQKLNKLTAAPRHWRGRKIPIRNGYAAPHYIPITVYQDDILVYCNHMNQEIEQVSFYAGLDDEYTRPASVCQKCGAGWDENGEQVLNTSN